MTTPDPDVAAAASRAMRLAQMAGAQYSTAACDAAGLPLAPEKAPDPAAVAAPAERQGHVDAENASAPVSEIDAAEPIGKPQKERYETTDFAAMMRRMIRAYARRVADSDVEDLAEMIEISGALDEAISQAVVGMRVRDPAVPWSAIARATGTTRQAAQQRWGRPPR